jgi:hypothetical protein
MDPAGPVPPSPSADAGTVTVEGTSRPMRFLRRGGVVPVVVVAVILTVLLGPLIVIPVLVAAAVVAGAVFHRSLAAAIRWHRPELVLPAGPVALGARPEVVYRRRPRAVRDLPTAEVHLTLVCEEVVTYRRGTDSVTETESVVEHRFGATGEGTPRGFEARVEVPIPHEAGGPTMDLGNNEIRWFLTAVMRGPGLPDDECRFPLTVDPVLDLSLGNEIGDR